jgi:hypothetical protein
MMQGLLLNRVDAESGGPAIGSQYHMIVLPFPDEAEAALVCVELAITRAEVALNSTVCQSVPISCRDGMYFFRGKHVLPFS